MTQDIETLRDNTLTRDFLTGQHAAAGLAWSVPLARWMRLRALAALGLHACQAQAPGPVPAVIRRFVQEARPEMYPFVAAVWSASLHGCAHERAELEAFVAPFMDWLSDLQARRS